MTLQHKPPGGPAEEFEHLRRRIPGPIVPMAYEMNEMVEWYDYDMQQWIPARVTDIDNDKVDVEVTGLEWNDALGKNGVSSLFVPVNRNYLKNTLDHMVPYGC